MSIIDDVRIKQDIDKDGKYVCDLNHKEETKFDIMLGKAMAKNTPEINMDTKFTLDKNGMHIPDTDIVIPPEVFAGVAHQWFLNAEKYSWDMKNVSRKDYIRNMIIEFQKLI